MKEKCIAPILIIVLIALGLGGYLFFQNQAKIISTPQPQTVTEPSPTPQETSSYDNTQSSSSPSPVSKPTIKYGWKSYSDSKIGFSYQLPENDNWSVKTTDIYCQLKLERNDGDQYLCIRVFDNPKGLSRREFYCSDILRQEDVQNCLNSYIEVKETKVGNKDALYITEPGTQVDHARVVSTSGKIIVVSDHAVSFPKIALSEDFNWNKLRDDILTTFWFN